MNGRAGLSLHRLCLRAPQQPNASPFRHPSHLYVCENYVVTHNTSFALNVGEHIALDLKLPVLVFSMEMGGTQLATRLLGSVGKVDAQKLRTGASMPGLGSPRLSARQAQRGAAPHRRSAGAESARIAGARAAQWREYGGLGFIVVDYIQLMQGRTRARRTAQRSWVRFRAA
jgi:replicative DNA helicase